MNFFFIFFVFGLIIGSFLNVLVYRLRDAETLMGRSFCRQCKHQIRWYDNIPLVSFIVLRGSCRDCETRISWQYPALELLTGIVFGLIGYLFFDPLVGSALSETLWLVVTVSCLLVIGAYDLRFMEIPMIVLGVSAVATLLYLVQTFLLSGEAFLASSLWYGLLGAFVIGGFFFLLVWMSHETWMGWGDVWLGAVAGLIVGLPLVLPMLTLSFGLGALVGLVAIALQKKGMKSQIPFAPFLTAGIILILFSAKFFPFFSLFVI
ncbi:MAG: prepilin peptidase [Candidatus Moranbacteria bacterium]|nr:prepilin peptidase [Candidatus Moranbacteria bacterium]MDD3965393.1 prepilin peptidase [Candidatus Moranbacteria bacterium]